MTDTVSLTVDWRSANSDLSASQQAAQTQSLFRGLRSSCGRAWPSLSSIEAVDRVADTAMPDVPWVANGLWSALTAEIPGGALRTTCAEIFDRLRHQPMEITIEVDGQAQKI